MKMTQFADFANNATKQILGTSGLIRENLQSMFSYPDAINVLNPVTVLGDLIYIEDSAPLNLKRAIVYIEPLQAGIGVPSPDNIRPIIGWSGANIVRCGKNILNPTTNPIWNYNSIYTVNQNGSVTVKGSDGRSWNDINFVGLPLKKGQYTLSFSEATTCNLRTSIDNYTENYRTTNGVLTFTLSKDCVVKWKTASTGYPFTRYVQIELGSTATPYEPYDGITYNITFPDGAGTVYGGVLDVINGILRVNRVNVNMGSLTYTYNSEESFFQLSKTSDSLPYPIKAINAELISDRYKLSNNGENYSFYDAGIRIRFINSNYDNVDDFKTAMNGAQLSYLIDTPIIYQTNPTNILMLNGINTIYADCGSMELEYYRCEGGGNPYV